MASSNRRRRKKAGASPGTVVYTGHKYIDNPAVLIIHYNPDALHEQLLRGYNCPPPAPNLITWYDVRGLSNEELIEHICHYFNVHTLAIEDIPDVHQRPKIEAYDNGLFFIVKAASFDEVGYRIVLEQIAFYLGDNFLLSFQEDADDLFPPIRERLKVPKGRLRNLGADYLAYALLDNIVDNYFPIIEQIQEKIENLEEDILHDVSLVSKGHIHHLKKQVLELRRAVLPLREVIGRFSVVDNDFMNEKTLLYFRDMQDHLRQATDNIENLRDMLESIQDLYHLELSNKANHVMKTLTIVSTIFIPLTFIVGVYGTNFENLPELKYPSAYFIMWGVMVFITISLLLYFKRKRWI
jgi:magnesium transporter